MSEIKRIGVLTSGGDAPGMNAAIRSVVRMGVHNGLKVYGIRRGYQGLLDDDFIEMKSRDVSEIIGKGGTILYTARCHDIHTDEGLDRAVENVKKHELDALITIGGDGTFRGAKDLADRGVNVIGVPATIDRDIPCTHYTIGFDTAVNTAMQAIDKIRDTSNSHQRCSIVEVMGRSAGYIALWCGISNGAEEVLIPEKFDNDYEKLYNHIVEARAAGKSHFLIINAEGIGHSTELAETIKNKTGMDTNATVLGYMQRGGSPTATDRYYGSLMGAEAVQQVLYGKKNRVIVCNDSGKIVDIEIGEALRMHKEISEDLWNICLQLRR